MNVKKRQCLAVRVDRAVKILRARATGPEAASKAEIEVAESILGFEVPIETCQQGLRPFEAAEFVASAYAGTVAGVAIKRNRIPPPLEKYSLLHSTDAIFRAIWRLRELIDQLGMPYDLYILYAMEYLAKRIVRIPRPAQLLAPDVIDHVLQQWLAYQAQQTEQMVPEPASGDSVPSDD